LLNDVLPRRILEPGRPARACRPALTGIHALVSETASGFRDNGIMAIAKWNGEIIAESDDTIVVEGNHYFPRDSVREEFLSPSDTHTYCGWKGDASYYSLRVNGAENKDAVWYYAEPFDKAEMVKDRVAFWNGVEVTA